MIEGLRRALVLAPHTDDGEFGCGATTARLVAKAYSVTRRMQPLWTGGCRPLDLEPLARRAGLRVVAREVLEQKGRASEVVCLSR